MATAQQRPALLPSLHLIGSRWRMGSEESSRRAQAAGSSGVQLAAVFVLEDEGFEGVAEHGCQSSNLATLTPRGFANRVSIHTVGSEPPVSSFRKYSRQTPPPFARS